MTAPKHVAIVGLGPSCHAYLEITRRLGARRKLADEVWMINALGDVFACDRVFHMDDVRIQQIRAAERPESNIAAMLEWMKEHPGPIITSQAHPDYPGLVEFPLKDFLAETEMPYLNSTAAYAIAYAIHIGVEKITIFGMDFTYPDAHDAEKGRACVEFWIGWAMAKGIEVNTVQTSTLMDAREGVGNRLYGYDCFDVTVGPGETGQIGVKLTPRQELPTADEIEARYDHSRHPNSLVETGGEQ